LNPPLQSGHGREDRLEAAAAIEQGIEQTIAAGEITRDIGGRLRTKEAGEALAARIGGA
jgi:3-isopropylmalate dehydrogenase